MKIKTNKNIGYWTKEKCLEEALKYKSRYEFQINSQASYKKSRYKGWLNEICSHMKEIHKPNGYWTKEKCLKESLRYTNRYDFQKYSLSAYSKALRSKWLNEICSHMKTK